MLERHSEFSWGISQNLYEGLCDLTMEWTEAKISVSWGVQHCPTLEKRNLERSVLEVQRLRGSPNAAMRTIGCHMGRTRNSALCKMLRAAMMVFFASPTKPPAYQFLLLQESCWRMLSGGVLPLTWRQAFLACMCIWDCFCKLRQRQLPPRQSPWSKAGSSDRNAVSDRHPPRKICLRHQCSWPPQSSTTRHISGARTLMELQGWNGLLWPWDACSLFNYHKPHAIGQWELGGSKDDGVSCKLISPLTACPKLCSTKDEGTNSKSSSASSAGGALSDSSVKDTGPASSNWIPNTSRMMWDHQQQWQLRVDGPMWSSKQLRS